MFDRNACFHETLRCRGSSLAKKLDAVLSLLKGDNLDSLSQKLEVSAAHCRLGAMCF